MAIPGIVLLGGAVVFLLAAAGKKKGDSPTLITKVVPTGPGSGDLPAENQLQLADCLSDLKVNSNGEIDGPVPAAAIAKATGTAAAFERVGKETGNASLVNAAATLRAYAKKAGEWVPTQNKVSIPALDAATVDKINRTIQMERDPKVLRQVADALKKTAAGGTPQAVALIQMLEAMATQIEAQQVTGTTLTEINRVIEAAKPAAMPESLPVPTKVNVPTIPVPQKLPAQKSAVEIAADNMVTHLRQIQDKYQTVKLAKGKQDTALVSKFQTLAGLKADGKPGPGTLIAAAKAGVGQVLPLVMYWPVSANAQSVYAYRTAIEDVAAKADAAGDTMRAAALRQSAARERGQAGIVGTMPA